MVLDSRTLRVLVRVGSLAAVAISVHSVLNCRRLHEPARDAGTNARVSVLIPVRDEAHQIADCLRTVLAQRGVTGPDVVLGDDNSTDGTVRAAARAGGGRLRVLPVAEPPPGWLGKPWACRTLAAAVGEDADVLVFLDADVRLEPDAVAAAVDALDRYGLQLVSVYPRLTAFTITERLIQPLLPWAWLSLLPLRLAEDSARGSLTVAGGQFLAVRAGAYRAAGGHRPDAVLDDVQLARAVKRTGGRVGIVGGHDVARCRMYAGYSEAANGYGKSLPVAFGSPAGLAAVLTALAVTYLLPPAAALTGSATGGAGYLAAVAGRIVCARRTGSRPLPDAAAHPASVALLSWFALRSLRMRGRIEWKGRPV